MAENITAIELPSFYHIIWHVMPLGRVTLSCWIPDRMYIACAHMINRPHGTKWKQMVVIPITWSMYQ